MKEIVITQNEAGQRIDRFLKKYMPEATTGFLYKMLRKKRIKLNDAKVEPEHLLRIGDTLQFYLGEDTMDSFKKDQHITMSKGEINVVYEDNNILLVNKPKGLLVHGDHTEKKDTLINKVYYYLNQKGSFIPEEENTFSPACCNRLDRNTSGIVIVAKNYPTLQTVNAMIKNDQITKKYIALVKGKVYKERELKGFLLKNERSNKVEVISQERKGAKFIHTKYQPLQFNNDYSLIEIHLITGRSHQIRAHLASEGFPIVGDSKYGNMGINREFHNEFKLDSQFLHAYYIKFENCPSFLSNLEGKSFRADLSTKFNKIIEAMGWEVI